ncbi:D-glycerate dehydrogenase [Pseudonocardia sp. C8]|uniref:2-hydroxyacid dehydrogenase n=1 Tax=Pseudonocardia sp. C8 TaxID=2762759 RepID=UPI001642933C|nr:D-glycerate dehydrogenase [Pseudonocardia sp. C8]MBC3190417.1 D-glycerate dehydrogenase [Pseudonocardia sp. C8]
MTWPRGDREPVVVVTRRWPTAVENELRRRYPAVRLSIDDRPLGPEGLRHAVEHADAVLATVSDRLPAELFAGDIRTRFVGNFGVGTDHIDLDAARAAGVTVTNTPGVLTESTADLAMCLLLNAARRTSAGERELRAGDWTGWRPTHLLGADVSGKHLGIIGMGRIGAAVARRARFGFDMRVSYCTHGSEDPGTTAARVGVPDLHRADSIEDLLAQVDFVSVHAPGGGENRHLISADRLKLMKPTAYLVNTARGDVVDTEALVEALSTGVIAGAGLDVHEGEPDVSPDLVALDNVTLLPHLGSATEGTRRAMGMQVLDSLHAFLEGADEVPCRVV